MFRSVTVALLFVILPSLAPAQEIDLGQQGEILASSSDNGQASNVLHFTGLEPIVVNGTGNGTLTVQIP